MFNKIVTAKECPRCKGAGRLIVHEDGHRCEDTCRLCWGSGQLVEEKEQQGANDGRRQ